MAATIFRIQKVHVAILRLRFGEAHCTTHSHLAVPVLNANGEKNAQSHYSMQLSAS